MANYSTNEFKSGLKILIDGDPTAHIEDVHKIAVVIKGGQTTTLAIAIRPAAIIETTRATSG